MGNHLICTKTRGCGFSYKEAADGVYNFHMIPGSKSYYFAALEEFLTKDGILNKVSDYLNHINQHTDFYKNRQVKDTMLHRKASYKEGTEEKGFMSEIIGTPVDNPNKTRGKRGKKITFEEAGSFKNLKLAYQICKESVEQGGFIAGQMSVFGTGGEEGEHIEGLEDMFNDPTTYNLLAFDNKWIEGGELDVLGDIAQIPMVLKEQPTNKVADSEKAYSPDTKSNTVGFFVPNFMANDKYIDEDGNVDREASIEFEINARKKLAKSKDPKTVDRKTAERPFFPDESFMRFHGNILPAHEAREQEKRIKNNTSIQGMIRHGVLVYGDKGVKFTPAKVTSLETYPHKNSDDLTGCVTLYESPYKVGDKIPDNLYMVVVDPYSKDDADDRTSLGVAYVIKRVSIGGGIGNIISAKYVARPKKLTMFYENILKLARYYNATVQSEIGGGGQGLIDFFRRKKMLHLLEYETELVGHNKEISGTKRNRSYFMNMNTQRKKDGLIYLADFLTEERGLSEEGNPVINIHKIYDIGLLQEIAKFREDRNADRISALIIGMYMLKEKHEVAVKTARKKNSFFSRPLYTDSASKSQFDGKTFWLD
jgi:hypothetical protein